MKEKIHPKYEMTQVSCACGNSFTTRSVLKEIKLDICSKCHPFFTGNQKLLDTEGRVDKFKKRFSKTDGKSVARKPKSVKTTRAGIAKIQAGVLSTAPKKTKAIDPKKAKLAKKTEKKEPAK